LTAAQETTATSGNERADEIPVAERTSTTMGGRHQDQGRMQATAKNTAIARIQGTLTATAGMTAAQETTATSGNGRTDEIPVAERTSTTVGRHKD